MHATLLLVVVAAATATINKEELFKQAAGPCIKDKCQPDYSCYYGQCLPKEIAPEMPEMKPEITVGPCINGLCPKNTFCHREECFPDL